MSRTTTAPATGSIELAAFQKGPRLPVPLPVPAQGEVSILSKQIAETAGAPGPAINEETDFEGLAEGPSKFTTAAVIASVTLITGLGSLLTGLITVAIPTMAADVGLHEDLLLWPASIFSLVCGCTLLLCGSVSDVLGPRFMYLTGCFLQCVFNLASGLCKTGGQLIVFRGLAGLAISFCLPSATAVITRTFPVGKKRNVAFACFGGGQPIGFALGLTLGGALAGTIGWRWGFYMAAILYMLLLAVAWRTIPTDEARWNPQYMFQSLINDIDWVGAFLASTSLAMISYVFATVSSSTTSIRHPINITILTISLSLLPAFHFWVSRQERLRRPALIPPSLWRSPVFSSICLCVFMTWGAFNALEQFLSFYFQYVQELSPMQSALRFLVEPASGVSANIIVGLLVHRVRGDVLVGVSSALALASPMVMALSGVKTAYWRAAFPAMLLNSPGADVLFTVSNLVITERFPERTQGLAGGVFQTVSQIGKSVGLALSAVVASSMTKNSAFSDKDSPDALMVGYKAAWWFCFGLSAITFVVGVLGLRKVGKVGEKRD